MCQVLFLVLGYVSEQNRQRPLTSSSSHFNRKRQDNGPDNEKIIEQMEEGKSRADCGMRTARGRE